MKVPGFDTDEWVSVGTAAAIADVSRQWMRDRAKAGVVRSIVIDGQWFICRKDAEKYERHPTFGRPRQARKK
jgi:hypothetical protein